MSTFQKIIILGYLGGDPETINFDGGGSLTKFSLATTESWKDKASGEKKDLTTWHNIVSRGKTGEIIEKYFKKGSRILVEGVVRSRSWDADGIKKYITEVHIYSFTFVDSKAQNETNANKQTSDPSPPGEAKEHDDLPF